jgi:hypothetical protein
LVTAICNSPDLHISFQFNSSTRTNSCNHFLFSACLTPQLQHHPYSSKISISSRFLSQNPKPSQAPTRKGTSKHRPRTHHLNFTPPTKHIPIYIRRRPVYMHWLCQPNHTPVPPNILHPLHHRQHPKNRHYSRCKQNKHDPFPEPKSVFHLCFHHMSLFRMPMPWFSFLSLPLLPTIPLTVLLLIWRLDVRIRTRKSRLVNQGVEKRFDMAQVRGGRWARRGMRMCS